LTLTYTSLGPPPRKSPPYKFNSDHYPSLTTSPASPPLPDFFLFLGLPLRELPDRCALAWPVRTSGDLRYFSHPCPKADCFAYYPPNTVTTAPPRCLPLRSHPPPLFRPRTSFIPCGFGELNALSLYFSDCVFLGIPPPFPSSPFVPFPEAHNLFLTPISFFSTRSSCSHFWFVLFAPPQCPLFLTAGSLLCFLLRLFDTSYTPGTKDRVLSVSSFFLLVSRAP